ILCEREICTTNAAAGKTDGKASPVRFARNVLCGPVYAGCVSKRFSVVFGSADDRQVFAADLWRNRGGLGHVPGCLSAAAPRWLCVRTLALPESKTARAKTHSFCPAAGKPCVSSGDPPRAGSGTDRESAGLGVNSNT